MISLPDLSKMQVTTYVNEVDISKVKGGQPVNLKLDAFPDREFHGKVAKVATIGKQRDQTSSIKVFEVLIDVAETDPVLKPGMTTRNEIIVESFPDTLFVPLEAVFEKEGKTIVYVQNGSSFDPHTVTLGVKSSDFVIVAEGLHADDRVSLIDPTAEVEKLKPESTKNIPQKKATGM